jgi:hypothetical protein
LSPLSTPSRWSSTNICSYFSFHLSSFASISYFFPYVPICL